MKFVNLENMPYHDDDCATHKALKAIAFNKAEGPLTMYLKDFLREGNKKIE